MEAKCRNEYSNDDVQKIERIIKQEDEEWKLKLLKEIEERENLPAENFIKEEFRNKEINKNIIKE